MLLTLKLYFGSLSLDQSSFVVGEASTITVFSAKTKKQAEEKNSTENLQQKLLQEKYNSIVSKYKELQEKNEGDEVKHNFLLEKYNSLQLKHEKLLQGT